MKRLFLILTVLLIASQTYAATYYMSESGAGSGNCSDYDNRCSRTYFGGGFRSMSPGDTLVLVGELDGPLTFSWSGDSDNQIIIDGEASAYEVGATDGFFDYSQNNNMLTIYEKEYITIKNIDFQGNKPSWSDNGGLYAEYAAIRVLTSSMVVDNIIIDNCTFTGTLMGVSVIGSKSTGHYDGVTITNNTFTNIPGKALWLGAFSRPATNYSQNIIIGGSTGNGNTFHNCGQVAPDPYNLQANGAILLDRCKENIISYNRVYCDDDVAYGMITIQLNEHQKTLIEYNIFDNNWNTDNHRTAISLKGDFDNDAPTISPTEGPTVIRFNAARKYYSDDLSWGSTSTFLSIGYDHVGSYVYGNYIINSSGIGASTAALSPWWNNGLDNTDIYIFSNVVAIGQTNGISVTASQSGSDVLDTVYVYNNTIYKQASYDWTLGAGYTIAERLTASGWHGLKATSIRITDGPYIKNNLVVDSRPNESDSSLYNPEYRIAAANAGLYWDKSYTSPWDYDHYYSSQNPASDRLVYRIIAGTNYSLDYDSSSRPGYGGHNSVGNPYFINAEGGDLRLSSETPASIVSGGTDMGNGNIYSGTIAGVAVTVPWDFALGKDTVWSFTDPDSISIDAKAWDTIGTWGKGAYYYEALGADTLAPTLQSAIVTSFETATILTITFNESCTGNAGFTVTPSGGASTLTYSSGTGATRVYTMSRALAYDETFTYSYSAGDVEDIAENPLATITNATGTNNSTIGYTPPAAGISSFLVNFASTPDLNFDTDAIPNWVPYTPPYSSDATYVAAWLFENNFNDSQSTNSLTTPGGVQVPSFTAVSPLQGTYSASFDKSSNQYCYIEDSALSSSVPIKSGQNGDFTILMRITPTTIDANAQRIFSKYAAASGKRSIELIISGVTQGKIYALSGYNSGDSYYTSDVPATAMTVDKTYYVAYAYNGTTGAYRLSVYDKDAAGLLHADVTNTWGALTYISDATLSIGNRALDDDPFDGIIDEVVIVADELDATEINAWFTRND